MAARRVLDQGRTGDPVKQGTLPFFLPAPRITAGCEKGECPLFHGNYLSPVTQNRSDWATEYVQT